MMIGKVVGSLVATVKISGHRGEKLLLIRRADGSGHLTGPVFVALDAARAGAGDYVLYTDEGGAAAMVSGGTLANTAVVGVLDRLPDEKE